MKHFTLLITFVAMMLLSLGVAQAVQVGLVNGHPSTGWLSNDTVIIDELVTFTFEFNEIPCTVVAFTNGFEVYTSSSVANPDSSGFFDAIQGDTLSITNGWLFHSQFNPNGHFDDVWISNYADGKGKDTIGFGAVWTTGNAPGFEAGWSEPVWYITTTAHTNGDTLCIDSCWFRPSNDWIWSQYPGCDPLSVFPTFGGPYCYYVLDTTLDVRTIQGPNLPTTYSLSQNYPNPFNPVTEIRFDIPKKSHVTLAIYNIVGQKVATLVDKELMPDHYVVDWDGTSDSGAKVATGVYFYKLQAEEFVETKKMMLLK
ncbi:MAG: T9SS type A sorting domain-containing protein [Candidatus Zixiibacteriota bacterium]